MTTSLFESAHSLIPASLTQRSPIRDASCRHPCIASTRPHVCPWAHALGTKTLPVGLIDRFGVPPNSVWSKADRVPESFELFRGLSCPRNIVSHVLTES